MQVHGFIFSTMSACTSHDKEPCQRPQPSVECARRVQEDRKRVLPRPGDYTCQYSATMLNKGGQEYWRTIKSPVFRYKAVCGAPVSCELHGWPQKVQLGALQHVLRLQLKDRFGNSTRGAVAGMVHLSSDQLDITCEVGQWTQAADGAHQLQLSAIRIKPLPAFHLPAAGQPLMCDVKLSVTPDSTLCLTQDYKINIFAGKTEDYMLVVSLVIQQTASFKCKPCTQAVTAWFALVRP